MRATVLHIRMESHATIRMARTTAGVAVVLLAPIAKTVGLTYERFILCKSVDIWKSFG